MNKDDNQPIDEVFEENRSTNSTERLQNSEDGQLKNDGRNESDKSQDGSENPNYFNNINGYGQNQPYQNSDNRNYGNPNFNGQNPNGYNQNYGDPNFNGQNPNGYNQNQGYNGYYYDGNGYPNYYNPETIDPENGDGKKVFGILSLIFGILSVVGCCCTWLGLALGVLAVIFGAIRLKSKNNDGMAIAGLITGIIGVVFGFFVILAVMLDFTYFSYGESFEFIVSVIKSAFLK